MKPYLTPDFLSFAGFEWAPRPGIQPCINQVAEARRHALLPHNVVRNGRWALDYFYTPVRFRAGDESQGWSVRKPDSVHLYPPDFSYSEDAPPGPAPVHHGWIQIATVDGAALDRFVRNRSGFAVFLDPEGLIVDRIRRMLAIGQDHGEAGFWRAQAVLCELLDLISNAAHVRGREYRVTGTVALDPLVVAVRQYIRAHLDRPLRLKDLAHATHVSISTLTHRYAQLTGESPMKTLHSIRMTLVRDVLERGGTVKEAAALAGFSSPQHLSKVFRESIDETPRGYVRFKRDADAMITGKAVGSQSVP